MKGWSTFAVIAEASQMATDIVRATDTEHASLDIVQESRGADEDDDDSEFWDAVEIEIERLWSTT